MDDLLDNLIYFGGTVLLILFCIIIAALFFVYMPRGIYAEQQCLAAGYPEAKVAYTLDAYCLNLQGDVTVSVKSLHEPQE